MTKARIEGLLAAFPKLMTGGRQHTFVETESVRYVYQPLDKLYMLLITTKASNILEDLETLRLFSRVVPEYCTQLTETEVLNQAFNLLFAFDEIVALGYRESVNLAQVRSFVEMDSHEEKIYQAVRQTQEREAANRMRERAKELQRERLEAAKRGGAPRSHMSFGSGFGSQSMSSASNTEPIAEKIPTTPARDTRPSTRSAMKLGSRGADTESFVSKLRSEGDAVAPVASPAAKTEARPPAPNQKDVHLRFEERLSLVAGRDGDIQNFELSGLLTLRISNEQFGRIQVHVDNKDTRPLQLQTHPNVDKEAFRSVGVIGLKQAQRPFPLHSDVGVLKWRLATNDDKLAPISGNSQYPYRYRHDKMAPISGNSQYPYRYRHDKMAPISGNSQYPYRYRHDKMAPISVNCWPSEGAGGCDVNIEYELEQEHLTLSDVHINIPLP
ncbi:hypothetical protein MSG28_015651 [Choristoneura fumiferana]|uniref:Uncharacterized protein n=1 Tax=Choristoneura fumiferana TaxID=7141 RepID=A0ACC0KAX4_CHOFU|nr:hypothetical protein MSG28_015651 [Choristoneura fumiferana]